MQVELHDFYFNGILNGLLANSSVFNYFSSRTEYDKDKLIELASELADKAMKVRLDRKIKEFPRIRDLPKKEQKAFRKFLYGQTVPVVEGVPVEDQDFYYSWDYDNFKRKPKDRTFD